MPASKQICIAWGLNPEEVLTKKALSKPHRTHNNPADQKEENLKTLKQHLKEIMRKELLKDLQIQQTV